MEQIRNFKDFLTLYNSISDTCFQRCTTLFGEREITSEEAVCVDNCAQKFININHRIMNVFVEVQGMIVQKKIEEMNKAQANPNLDETKGSQNIQVK